MNIQLNMAKVYSFVVYSYGQKGIGKVTIWEEYSFLRCHTKLRRDFHTRLSERISELGGQGQSHLDLREALCKII